MKAYIDKITDWYNKLSKREKLLVSLPLPVILFILFHSLVYVPVSEAFNAQNKRLEESSQNIKIIAACCYQCNYNKFKYKFKH